MLAKEIDEKINNGESLIMCFGIRKNSFLLGNHSITEKQYYSAKERFKGKLELSVDYGGLTKHYYKLKESK